MTDTWKFPAVKNWQTHTHTHSHIENAYSLFSVSAFPSKLAREDSNCGAHSRQSGALSALKSLVISVSGVGS